MTPPPLTCPPPPQSDAPDCPLYEQRVGYSPDEALRRAILTERSAPNLAALIGAEPAPVAEAVEAEATESLPDEAARPAPPALPAPGSRADALNP